MTRHVFAAIVSVFFLGATALSGTARADDSDDLKDLMADCGGPNLSASDTKDCLERAREMDDERPSPQLQGLLARLERHTEALEDAERSGSSEAPTAKTPPQSLTAPATADNSAGTVARLPDYAKKTPAEGEPNVAADFAASDITSGDDTAPEEVEAPDAGPPTEPVAPRTHGELH